MPGTDGVRGPSFWFLFLDPYYRNTNVLLCPATKLNPEGQRTVPGTADQAYRIVLAFPGHITDFSAYPRTSTQGSYTFNGWLGPRNTPAESSLDRRLITNAYRKESEIILPSETPVFADGLIHDFVPDHFPGFVFASPKNLYHAGIASQLSLAQVVIGRHGRGGTVRKSTPITAGQSLGPYVNQMVFFDGHVGRVKLDHLWRLRWHKNWEPLPSRPN